MTKLVKYVFGVWIFLVVGGMGLIAFAQQATNDLSYLTGSEVINTYANTLLSQVYSTQLRDAVGYQKVINTGVALNFAYGQSVMQIPGTSTITALTINLAANPVDGQVNCFYTKPAITTLTLQKATSSQTLNDPITSASATTRYCYTYSLSNTTWDRTQ